MGNFLPSGYSKRLKRERSWFRIPWVLSLSARRTKYDSLTSSLKQIPTTCDIINTLNSVNINYTIVIVLCQKIQKRFCLHHYYNIPLTLINYFKFPSLEGPAPALEYIPSSIFCCVSISQRPEESLIKINYGRK